MNQKYSLNVNGTAHSVEADEDMARTLQASRPGAVRRLLATLSPAQYAAIFALDSLEHNEHVASIVDRLVASLRDDGILIISGPTENFLYKAGRRIARFDGHYHKTTIYDIERTLVARVSLVRRRILPLGIPLFSITCWKKK